MKKPRTRKKGSTSSAAVQKVSRAITRKGKTAGAREFDKAIAKVMATYKITPQYPAHLLAPGNALSTGLYGVDVILSGGLHAGRLYTFYGAPSVGKSTLCQQVLKKAQEEQIRIYHFDPEFATEAGYAERQGALLDESYRLGDGSQGYIYLPDIETGQDLYRVSINMLRVEEQRALAAERKRVGPPRVLVLNDSYASYTSEGLTDTNSPIGANSRMHAEWQDRYRTAIRRAHAVSLATNQTRVTGIGSTYVREHETGGNALKFFADVRVEMSSSKAKEHNLPDGVVMSVFKTVKNRTTMPYQKAKLWMVIGRGFDPFYDRLMFLVMSGVIEKDGAYYVIDGKKYPRKIARKMMSQRRWIHECEKQRLDVEVYRRLLGIDKVMEENWDEE